MLVVALSAIYFRIEYLDRYREDAVALKRLASSGGSIHKIARKPRWLWEQFGDKLGEKGTSLDFSDTDIGDDQLADISRLSDLGGLYLDRTKITDKGIENIKDMAGLIAVSMRRTSITKLPPLTRLSNLVDLDLAFTDVTEIKTDGLLSLGNLNLRGTQITDQTLAGIGALPNLRTLDIAGSPGTPMMITDKGIDHLTKDKLPKLSKIYLYFTEVTEVGIAQLGAEFPGLQISR